MLLYFLYSEGNATAVARVWVADDGGLKSTFADLSHTQINTRLAVWRRLHAVATFGRRMSKVCIIRSTYLIIVIQNIAPWYRR